MKFYKVSQNNELSDKVLQAEKVIKEALENEDMMVLFHSSTSDKDPDINKYGLIAQFGEWLEEVLSGATDDEDLMEEIKERSQAVFMSREPSWIMIKISKKIDKPYNNITLDDIRQYGQLSIVTVFVDTDDIYQATEEDLNYGKAESFGGKEIYDDEIPFGVESNDIFSIEDVGVDITLTGNDLVMFMQRNYPELLPNA